MSLKSAGVTKRVSNRLLRERVSLALMNVMNPFIPEGEIMTFWNVTWKE